MNFSNTTLCFFALLHNHQSALQIQQTDILSKFTTPYSKTTGNVESRKCSNTNRQLTNNRNKQQNRNTVLKFINTPLNTFLHTNSHSVFKLSHVHSVSIGTWTLHRRHNSPHAMQLERKGRLTTTGGGSSIGTSSYIATPPRGLSIERNSRTAGLKRRHRTP